ncbi:hypothetical protein HAX54_027361 [Datura stramonium]|uniref:Uncharacterized protein n=1 Tax=Datura stramonium TaxID=4076 RepID=A0ABS8V293_DATST|nr:hypothetical protein [Datura stramonium]
MIGSTRSVLNNRSKERSWRPLLYGKSALTLAVYLLHDGVKGQPRSDLSWFSAEIYFSRAYDVDGPGRALNGLGWPHFMPCLRETPNTGLDRLYEWTFWVLRSKVRGNSPRSYAKSTRLKLRENLVEGRPPMSGVPQTDTGKQVEYTRALEEPCRRTRQNDRNFRERVLSYLLIRKAAHTEGIGGEVVTHNDQSESSVWMPNLRTDHSGEAGPLRVFGSGGAAAPLPAPSSPSNSSSEDSFGLEVCRAAGRDSELAYESSFEIGFWRWKMKIAFSAF